MKNSKVLKYVSAFLLIVILLVIIKHVSHIRWSAVVPHNFLEKYADPVKTDNMNAAEDASAYVVLFDNVNTPSNTFSKKIRKSINDLRDVGFNDKTRSFQLGPFSKVTFYEHINFAGRKIVFENKQDIVLTVPSFTDEFFDAQASSFQLELLDPHMIAYTQENLGGYSKVFTGDVPTLTTDWQKCVSFRLSPFTKVMLFKKSGYIGLSKEYVNSSSQPMTVNYIGADWINSIGSLKVHKLF